MIEISFAAAFFGGVLALLSPCSALLLPAFFAYAFQSKTQLTTRTAIFYLGLITIFVPLGMGASLASVVFIDHRDAVILVAGLFLVAFGVLEVTGRSLSVLRLSGSSTEKTRSLLGTYSLGLVYGFGGFCSGPILGSVLTVAATDGNVLRGGGLLATYALGTVIPLLVLAWLWERAGIGKMRWIRGRGFQLGPLAVHSTNLIAGTLFVLLGLSFIVLRGTNALAGTYEGWGLTEVSFDADSWVKDSTSFLSDELFLLAVALLAAGLASSAIRRILAHDGDEDQHGDVGETEAVAN